MISRILKYYNIGEHCSIEPLTSGLINRTWKITDGENQFILQQINTEVFKKPLDVAANISMIKEFLDEHSPDYLFVSPLASNDGQYIIQHKDDGYFRMFPFIKGSHTVDVVSSADQAYQAAFQFGKFAKLLSRFEVNKLHNTIPDFHNLRLRYHQFEQSLENGNKTRIQQADQLVRALKTRTTILDEFERLRKNPAVKKRVTHHDTKISNVLFDADGKGMCVIDLDTIMPGYFISDVGDMMRTYLSPANEEEKDFNKIEVREDFYSGIVQGYTEAMQNELTYAEKKLINYSGPFLIYMQALRFLTDYFNNDRYYGAKYEEHNFARAGNQVELLKRIEAKQDLLEAIVSKEVNLH
jgi:Ser/Thr protein kinase RdoA (MazF antagonist)